MNNLAHEGSTPPIDDTVSPAGPDRPGASAATAWAVAAGETSNHRRVR